MPAGAGREIKSGSHGATDHDPGIVYKAAATASVVSSCASTSPSSISQSTEIPQLASPIAGSSLLAETTSQLLEQPKQQDSTRNGPEFMQLPPEVREMIWRHALPEPRVFSTLVYVSHGVRLVLLERSGLQMPLAHVCFESRRFVQDAGYKLAFDDESHPDDPGVWYHPDRDIIDRSIWGPGDFVS